jgi:hypothetical protein
MARVIALTAPTARGLFCASSHEPSHADGGREPVAVTERSGQEPPQRCRAISVQLTRVMRGHSLLLTVPKSAAQRTLWAAICPIPKLTVFVVWNSLRLRRFAAPARSSAARRRMISGSCSDQGNAPAEAAIPSASPLAGS